MEDHFDVDRYYEENRVTSGEFRNLDWEAQRQKLEALARLDSGSWTSGYHPWEDKAA